MIFLLFVFDFYALKVKVLRNKGYVLNSDKLTFIDLFAGIGGFHQGFTNAGFECLMASEFNPHCQHVYEKNYGIKPFGDIRNLSSSDVPDHSVLTAGFPCQPFSICGHKKGFEDTRGTLFFDICRIASDKNTDVLVLENVKHLIHHDSGNTLLVIMNTLNEMGYEVSYSVLNAVNFGVPQNRERLIIVASKIGLFDFSKIRTYQQKVKLRDFLDNDSDDMEYLSPDDYTILKKTTLQPKSGLIFAGYRNKKTRQAGIRPDTEHLSRVHKQPNRIYHVDGCHPTLPSQEVSGRFFIYIPETNKVRKLTIKECYRIMGYNERFLISGSKAEAYKQIGNSVCIPMVQALANELKYQLFNKKKVASNAINSLSKTMSNSQEQLKLL